MHWSRWAVSFASRDHPALVAAARHRLPGVAPLGDAPAVVAAHDVEAIRLFCRTDRISGLLAGALHSGEVVSDGDALAESVTDDWHAALHACVLIEALLVRLADRLIGTDLRWRVTKGAAVAHLDYPDASLRHFADIDLVVHPDDWDAVLTLLRVERTGRAQALSFAHRYGKGATAMVDEMEVDLHLRFAVGRFGTQARMAECFAGTDTFELAGREIPVLDAEFRLLHACHHAVLGGEAELRAFRDVAQMALASPVAFERTWEIARSWRVESVVATALIETWSRLRLPMDHPVMIEAGSTPISRADRRTLEVFASGAPFRSQAATSLGALPMRERPGFAVAAWKMSRERRS